MNIHISSFGTVADDYVYVYFDGRSDNFLTEFPLASGKPAIENNHMAFNGDDRVRIIDSTGSVYDLFETPGVDAYDDYSQNGIDWHYRNSWAKRNPGQGPSATFDVNQYFPNDTAQLAAFFVSDICFIFAQNFSER